MCYISHLHGLGNAWDHGSWRSEPRAGIEDAIRWLVSEKGCIQVLGERLADYFNDELDLPVAIPSACHLLHCC